MFKSWLNEELPVWDIFLSAGTLGTSGDKKDMFPHHTPEYMDSVKNGEGPQTLKKSQKAHQKYLSPKPSHIFSAKEKYMVPCHFYCHLTFMDFTK